jgi:hypothetical protein
MLAKKLLGAAKSAVVDAYYNLVTLLLPGNGINGAQNNTFLDSSTNNFTITRNGNTTQGTFSPFSVGASQWSNYFDGSGDYLGNTSSALITQNVSTFTIEGWIYMTANPTSDVNNISGFITVDGQPANTFNYMAFGPISSRVLYLRWFDGAGKTANGSTTLNLNQWYHIACVVNSNAIQFYVNGVAETMSGTTTLTNRNGTAGNFSVGSHYYGAIAGYLSNVRVTTTAVYTAGFTTPTSPLTAITNTSLLTCQSNRFVDNSSNAYALTVGGTPSVQAFSPFAPTAAYSASTVGGSGYFDGSGDYLDTPSNSALALGTGNFTVEFWVYVTAHKNYIELVDARGGTGTANAVVLYTDSSGILYYFVNGSNRITSSAALSTNAWNHVAVARSGTDTKLFVNGTQSGSTYTDSTDYIQSVWRIASANNGSGADATNYSLPGYISNFRVVKGTAVYTAGFTPPTAPLTAITNTSLLLNFTNAGITDATSKNVLETVGNAQISTTQSKFGGSSMYFDGTGDWLLAPSSQNFNMGTGNWTVECWVYPSSTATRGLFQITTGHLNSVATGIGLGVSTNTGNPWRVYHGTTATDTSTNITTGSWQHIAFVRNGSAINLYLDGTSIYSATDSSDLSSYTFLTVGAWYSSSFPWLGYIDDLRITKGYARYTANFTAPTAPFALQ